MIAFLTSRIGAALAAAAVGAGILAGTYWYAYQQGRAAERLDALNRSIEILRERNVTDDEIREMDDAELCALLGGVYADGSCQ